MSRENLKFETIEDMVKYAVKHNFNSGDKRWSLETHRNREYLDAEAGKGWDEKYILCKSYDERQELYSSQPEQKEVLSYYLYEVGDGWHKDSINLGKELGEQVYDIWTKKESRYSKSYVDLSGRLTIIGILKRLGRTDVSDKIKKAEAEEKIRLEKVYRNNSRNSLRKHVEEMQKDLQKLGLTNESTLADILDNLIDEE